MWWRGAEAVRASIRDAVAHRPPEPAGAGAGAGGRRRHRARSRPGGRLPHDRAHPPAGRLGHQPDPRGRVPAGARPVVRGPRPLAVRAGCRRHRRVRAAGADRAERGAGGRDGHGRHCWRWAPTAASAGACARRGGGRPVAGRPGAGDHVGFALSVVATAGILLLAPGWRDAMCRWLPRWLAEAIAVPATAQLACTPLVAAISGQVSLVAVRGQPGRRPGGRSGDRARPGRRAGRAGLAGAGGRLGTLAALCVAWIVEVARRGADLPTAAVDWGTGACVAGGADRR